MKITREFAEQILSGYCRICADEAVARAEIEHEAEMERRVERAFEQRRW